MNTVNFLASSLTRRCVISSSVPSRYSEAAFGSNGVRRSISNVSGNGLISHSPTGTGTGNSNNMIQPSKHVNVQMMSNALMHSNLVSSKTLFAHSTVRSMSSLRNYSYMPLRDHTVVSHKTLAAPIVSLQYYPFTGYHSKLLPTPASSSSSSNLQTRSFASQKHKRIIRMAKGYRGRANRTYRAAIRRVEKGLQYSYRDRKVKKRNFRRLWIERVNAGVRQHGMSYSRFIRGMQRVGKKKHGAKGEQQGDDKQQGILLNRKVLANLAANEPFSFKAVVDVVKMKMGQMTGGSK